MDTLRLPPHFDAARYLAALAPFATMDNEALQRLAQGCPLKAASRGDIVQRAGDPCDALHVTVAGQIKLFALSAAGQEKVIEIVGPGGSFGDAPMFLEQPSLLSAQALTDVLLLEVRRRALVDEIERNPAIALGLLAGLSRRLHGMVRDVQAHALQSGTQRVIGYLLREHDDAAGASDPGQAPVGVATVSLPVSKATVASRLSLTPEYFSRVLHELEAARLITIERRDIHVPDLARLAAYAPH